MQKVPGIDDWTRMIVQEAPARMRELRRARVTEVAFSLLGTLCMFGAVWGFTAPPGTPGQVDPHAAGGLALLTFCGCMILAAGGGIRRRLITLVVAMESRER